VQITYDLEGLVQQRQAEIAGLRIQLENLQKVRI
jgi:hypothetical protein